MVGTIIEGEADAPTFYLETSACGSLAPRQPADRKQAVRQLLNLLDGVRGRCVLSGTVLEEIEASPPAVAETILDLKQAMTFCLTQRKMTQLANPKGLQKRIGLVTDFT